MNLEIRLDHDNKHFAILKLRKNFFFLDDDSFLLTGVKIDVNKLFEWQLNRFFLYFLGGHDETIKEQTCCGTF